MCFIILRPTMNPSSPFHDKSGTAPPRTRGGSRTREMKDRTWTLNVNLTPPNTSTSGSDMVAVIVLGRRRTLSGHVKEGEGKRRRLGLGKTDHLPCSQRLSRQIQIGVFFLSLNHSFSLLRLLQLPNMLCDGVSIL